MHKVNKHYIYVQTSLGQEIFVATNLNSCAWTQRWNRCFPDSIASPYSSVENFSSVSTGIWVSASLEAMKKKQDYQNTLSVQLNYCYRYYISAAPSNCRKKFV